MLQVWEPLQGVGGRDGTMVVVEHVHSGCSPYTRSQGWGREAGSQVGGLGVGQGR